MQKAHDSVDREQAAAVAGTHTLWRANQDAYYFRIFHGGMRARGRTENGEDGRNGWMIMSRRG